MASKLKLPDEYRQVTGDERKPPVDYSKIPIGTIVKLAKSGLWKASFDPEDAIWQVRYTVVSVHPNNTGENAYANVSEYIPFGEYDENNWEYYLNSSQYPCRIVALKREGYDCWKCKAKFYDEFHYLCPECRI